MRTALFVLAVTLHNISGRRVQLRQDESESGASISEHQSWDSKYQALRWLMTQLSRHDRMVNSGSRDHKASDHLSILRHRGGARKIEPQDLDSETVAEALSGSISNILRTAPDWELFAEDVKLVFSDVSALDGLTSMKLVWNFLHNIYKRFTVDGSIEAKLVTGRRAVKRRNAQTSVVSKWRIEVGDRKRLLRKGGKEHTIIDVDLTFNINKQGLVDRIQVDQLRIDLEVINRLPHIDLLDTSVKNLEMFLGRARQTAKAARAFLKQQMQNPTNMAELGMANLEKALKDPEMFRQLMNLMQDSEAMAMINDVVAKDPAFQEQVAAVSDEDVNKLVNDSRFKELQTALADNKKPGLRIATMWR